MVQHLAFFTKRLPLVTIVFSCWLGAEPSVKPIPDGVTELSGIGADGGIIELKDGSLLLAQGGGVNDKSADTPVSRISRDRGRSWGPPEKLNSPLGVGGLIRLKSGALAIYGRKATPGAALWEYYFSTSLDEGKTWSAPVLISNYPNYYPMHHSLIQLSNNRLLLTGYWEGFNGGEGGAAHRLSLNGWGLIGVGRAYCSPSLRTVQADLPHTALQSVVLPG